MAVEVIDQTASETRLHRVLYVLQFLRVGTLHVFLVIMAITLFTVWGIQGLYFAADDAINGVKQAMNNVERQGSPVGATSVLLIFGVIAVILIAFSLWMYLSITRVRRISLRLQSGILLYAVLYTTFGFWQQVKFSFENLNIVFSGFVALYYLFAITITLDMAIALWCVARSQETSSFLATLDPRLVRGYWAFVNKFLDLPRTPFRNRWTVAAYMLSLFGTILLVVCVFYVLTVGGATNKLAKLLISCGPANMASCVRQSSTWAKQITLGLLLSLVGVRAARMMQSGAKRLVGLSVPDVLKGSDERFVLYLRPFDTDNVILPKPSLPLFSRLVAFRPFPLRVEEELFDVADGHRPLIAVAQPSVKGSEVTGLAYRISLQDQNWQSYVGDKIREAESVVLLLKDTPGVRWELSSVINEGAVGKTLFLFDPTAKDAEAWRTLAKAILPSFESAGFIRNGFMFQARPIGFFFTDEGLVEIINLHWSATSYRTAFSYFLAERTANANPIGT